MTLIVATIPKNDLEMSPTRPLDGEVLLVRPSVCVILEYRTMVWWRDQVKSCLHPLCVSKLLLPARFR